MERKKLNKKFELNGELVVVVDGIIYEATESEKALNSALSFRYELMGTTSCHDSPIFSRNEKRIEELTRLVKEESEQDL